MKSENFKISKPMLSLLEQHGITAATPVQQEIIPAIQEGRDVLAQSETGSGKTLSFAVPIIEQTNRRDGLVALVLVPTRELCVQVAGEFMKFSAGKQLGITSVYGGVSIANQIKKMRTTNIIVATPGRLLDLLERKAVSLGTIRYLVLDEADRMLDMGFIRDIERILRHIPQERQTLLFSATVSQEVTQLSRKYLRDPKQVHLASAVKPDFLHQTYYHTTLEQKLPLLIALLKRERELALIFCNRKHFASKLATRLSGQGINARALHGGMSQAQRERVTAEFRQKKINLLVATDVAARGLHIEGITHVYNYEIPRDVESYTHRVGRTARAGKKGEAISLVARGEEEKFFKQILFTYRGDITLKTMEDVPPLIATAGAPERKRRPESPSHSTGRQRESSPKNRNSGTSQNSQRNRNYPRRGTSQKKGGEKRPSGERGQSSSTNEESSKDQSKWKKAWQSWMKKK